MLPNYSTPLDYDGLCRKYKCEQDRNAALVWTPKQIAEKQKKPIQNIHRLCDIETIMKINTTSSVTFECGDVAIIGNGEFRDSKGKKAKHLCDALIELTANYLNQR